MTFQRTALEKVRGDGHPDRPRDPGEEHIKKRILSNVARIARAAFDPDEALDQLLQPEQERQRCDHQVGAIPPPGPGGDGRDENGPRRRD